MTKKCAICGAEYESKGRNKCCSPSCSDTYRYNYKKQYDAEHKFERSMWSRKSYQKLHKSGMTKIQRECQECVKKLEELEKRDKKFQSCPYECRMAHISVKECGRMNPVHESSGVTYIKVPDERCKYEHK